MQEAASDNPEIEIDEAGWAAWKAILTTSSRVLERIEQALAAEVGLPLAWFDVLVNLHWGPPNGLRMGQLAGRVLLTRSTLTRVVDQLEAEGLVARGSDPEDRRATRILLTPAGASRYAAAAPTHDRVVAEVFLRHLGPGSAAAIARTLAPVGLALGDDPAPNSRS